MPGIDPPGMMATLNSIRASVSSAPHEGRFAMDNGEKPSSEIPTIIKKTIIKCALLNWALSNSLYKHRFTLFL